MAHCAEPPRISQTAHSQRTHQPDRREQQAQHPAPRDPLNHRVIFGQMRHLAVLAYALLRGHFIHQVQGRGSAPIPIMFVLGLCRVSPTRDRLLAAAVREVGIVRHFHVGSPHSPSSLLMLVRGLFMMLRVFLVMAAACFAMVSFFEWFAAVC